MPRRGKNAAAAKGSPPAAEKVLNRLGVSTGSDQKAVGAHIAELRTLVVGYAKQETVDPLKAIGRQMAAGIAGSICIAIGVFFLLLALLRGLQGIDAFQPDGASPGALTLVPYAVTLVVALMVLGLLGLAISRDAAAARRKAGR